MLVIGLLEILWSTGVAQQVQSLRLLYNVLGNSLQRSGVNVICLVPGCILSIINIIFACFASETAECQHKPEESS